MKIKIIIFLLITTLLYIGCDTDSDPVQPEEIGVNIILPYINDWYFINDSMKTLVELEGSIQNYSKVEYYIGNDSLPFKVFHESYFDSITLLDSNNFRINESFSTKYLIEGQTYFKVIAYDNYNNLTEDTKNINMVYPLVPKIILPQDSSQFIIGDLIEFEVTFVQGQQTLFMQFSSYLDSSDTTFYSLYTYNDTIRYYLNTDSLFLGDHIIRVVVRNYGDYYDIYKEDSLSFNLSDTIK